MKKVSGVAALVLAAVFFAAPGADAAARKRVHPDVLRVEVRRTGAGVYSFDVTISSPDTGWKKYTNAFRIKTEDGTVLGTRTLYHPHVNEQPFTRSLHRVKIPSGTKKVVIEARDSAAGWGGTSRQVAVPR